MNLNVAAKYRNVQISTGNPAALVAMLFDGALRFAAEAKDALAKRDPARAGDRIGRCHAVVSHLASTLDKRHAPEMCDNLEAVYGFCMRRLVEANLAQSADMVAEVVRALTPLRDAWATLARA